MINDLTRRKVWAGAVATAAVGRIGPSFAEGGLTLGEPLAFSFDILKDAAKRIAESPYREPTLPSPEIVGRIDYETWGKIAFDTDYALFADGPGRFAVTFFHLGKFFPKPVKMHVIRAGEAREIIYDPRYFLIP